MTSPASVAHPEQGVYLDHAATTPVRPEVVEAMAPFYGDRFGNPSGSHARARDARKAVDEARDVVAECLGCEPSEVVFLSGGTEADNLAVLGSVRRHGGEAVCSAIEHHAVLHPVEHLGGKVVAVGADGVIDLDALAAVLSPATRIVSVMLANNEVGVVQPLHKVARLVARLAPQAWVHTDAVQAVTWLDIAAFTRHLQMLSVTAHKFGGPKGAGAIVIRRGVTLEPLLFGGGQEHDRRSGTHDVAGIVGLAAALRLATAERAEVVERVGRLRDRLVDGVIAAVPGVHEVAPRAVRLVNNAHLCVDDVESEALLFLLDRAGIQASAASACASGALEMSHVLAAMNVPKEWARGALRLTLGRTTTEADVDRTLAALVDAVGRLRS